MNGAPTGFLGLSHLGIVSSIGWASLGFLVWEWTWRRGRRLCRGGLPVHEPGLAELLAASRSA